MAYTVDSAFATFYENINLGGDHRETANARKDNVVSLLGNHFEILDAFATGSIPKFTALRGKADVDVMVVLHFGKHIKGRSPNQVLQEVRDALGEYRTGVRKNGQAVTLSYKTWPDVDVVPVSRTVNDNGSVSHYNVPDANLGTWIKSLPKTHAAEIEKRASDKGANFRKIIKMAKAWNHAHSDYLQSYHIEVLALKVLTKNLIDLPWSTFQFFSEARPMVENRLWHKLGYADEYLSSGDRTEVLKRFDTAIDRSRRAWYATYGSNQDHAAAIGLWKQVFGEKFPTYG